MDEKKTAASAPTSDYRNGVRDLLEHTIAHATVIAMVGRAPVKAGGAVGPAAAEVTHRVMHAWFEAMDAIPEDVSIAIFTEAREAADGREAPICGSMQA